MWKVVDDLCAESAAAVPRGRSPARPKEAAAKSAARDPCPVSSCRRCPQMAATVEAQVPPQRGKNPSKGQIQV